ncbi:MAG: hypothetical protein HY747_06130 [Elusimicrobia bacterium]|nr:hypothetical protein [Elusimicrobiota bacterium]
MTKGFHIELPAGLAVAVILFGQAWLGSTKNIPALGIETTKTHISATAVGLPPEYAKTGTQKKSLARDAAIAEAQLRLLLYVQEFDKGGKPLSELIKTDKKLELKTKGALSRAEIIKTEWKQDGTAVVTLRLAKKYLKKIRGLKIP